MHRVEKGEARVVDHGGERLDHVAGAARLANGPERFGCQGPHPGPAVGGRIRGRLGGRKRTHLLANGVAIGGRGDPQLGVPDDADQRGHFRTASGWRASLTAGSRWSVKAAGSGAGDFLSSVAFSSPIISMALTRTAGCKFPWTSLPM